MKLIHLSHLKTHVYGIIKGDHGDYVVEVSKDNFACTCPHHLYRGALCKHIRFFMDLLSSLGNFRPWRWGW